MSQTRTNASADLQVDVASPPFWTFAPGDSVIGTVTRRSPIITSEAIVRVELVGRLKVKLDDTNSNNNVHRVHKQIIKPTASSVQDVCRGPLHLPVQDERSGEDFLSWPFSLEIPTHARREIGFQRAPGRSDAENNNGPRPPLPGSFHSYRSSLSTDSEAFIEYYVEAHMRYKRKGHYENLKSTAPITLGRFPGVLLHNYNLQHSLKTMCVRSQRLLPGMQNAELSLKQKTQKFFASSKVPELQFSVKFVTPAVIQLDYPTPFPLILEVNPWPEKTSPAVQDVDHRVQLSDLKIFIRSSTLLSVPSNFNMSSIHQDYQYFRQDLGVGTILKSLESPLAFSSQGRNEPVNIGNMFRLILRERGLAGKRPTLKIWPSFSTACIEHTHALEIEAYFSVVGELCKVEARSNLTILPPYQGDQ